MATIAVSLFVGGIFLLLSENLSRLALDWRGEAKVVVYLDAGATPADRAALDRLIAAAPWVASRQEVTAEQARERFEEIFPSLADLARGWDEEPLPASIELGLDAARTDDEAYPGWLESLRGHPAVGMLDDDRDWLRQLEILIAVLRGVGLTLGAILMGGAIFTIASVIRLTAYLYRDEIAVMRLVGATELYIRGPFYLEGLLQGLAGGLAAVAGLYAAYRALSPYGATATLLGSGLLGRFLGLEYVVGLVALGCAAGILGAVVSLQREAAGGS